MKKTVIAALFSFGFITGAQAQAPCPPSAPDWDRLATRLGLEYDQREDFSAVMEAEHEKREAVHQQAFDDMKEGMEAIDQETLEKLANVLSEDQLAALEALQTDMRRHRPGPPRNEGDRPTGERGRMPPRNGACQPPMSDEQVSQAEEQQTTGSQQGE